MSCQYVVRHRKKTLEGNPGLEQFKACTHPSKLVKVGHVEMDLCRCHLTAMKRSKKYKRLLTRAYRAKKVREFKWRPQKSRGKMATKPRRGSSHEPPDQDLARRTGLGNEVGDR